MLGRLFVWITIGAGILLAWEYAGSAGWVSPLIMPRPTGIAESITRNWRMLATSAIATTSITLIGLGLGVLMGVLTWSILSFAKHESSGMGFFVLSGYEALPKVALAPIFVLWFGVGPTFRVFLSASMTVFIFFVFAIQVAALKRHPLVELARSIGTSWTRTSAFVIWPLSRPLLGACFRLAAPAALVGTIVAEFVASSSGLGHVLLSALGSLNSELAFACIFLIATIGGLLQGLGALIEGPRIGLNN